jgi:hypothetical protein
MIRGEEVRRYNDAARKLRKGWLGEGHRLLDALDQRSFGHSTDWLRFLPDGLELFTTSDLAGRFSRLMLGKRVRCHFLFLSSQIFGSINIQVATDDEHTAVTAAHVIE